MKTSTFLGVTVGILIASIAYGAPISVLSFQGNDGEVIIIRQDTTDELGAPRTPVQIPFFAELMNGYVILGTTTPCGTVSVRITSTAGDDYSTNFDTSDGAILLPISGNPGDYTLSITTPAGTHFIGEFSI